MAWYWAAADPRVSAIAPAIGVQSFRYALEHDAWHARAGSPTPTPTPTPTPSAWHARAGSLAPLMAAAAADMGRALDAEVVRAVWAKIAPGIDG